MKWFLAFAMAAVVSLCGGGAAVQARRRQGAKKRRQEGGEWLTNGHDLGDNRYSPLKQIDTTNASRLGLAWSYDTNGTFGTVETTPIVWDGILYGTAPWSIVYALDAKTGKEIWRWDPKIPRQNFPAGSVGKPDKVRTGPSVCCGPANRGVALYDGKIYVGTLEAKLVALDAKTGKEVWSVQTADMGADYSVTGAPIIAGGKVIIGNAGGEYSARGFVSAYDAETGKLDLALLHRSRRSLQAVREQSHGNRGQDLDRGMVETRRRRHGLGRHFLRSRSRPALHRHLAGRPVGRQVSQPARRRKPLRLLHHRPQAGNRELRLAFPDHSRDEWDYDATQGMTLADIKINGKVRKVLMQAPKNGFFYVLDRKTGEFISGKPYVKVTWATGLDPKTGKPIEAPNMRYDQEERAVSPGPAGGHAWQGMSYNPNTGLVYLPALDSDFRYIATKEFKPEVGVYSWGIVFRPPPPPAPGTARQLPTPREDRSSPGIRSRKPSAGA